MDVAKRAKMHMWEALGLAGECLGIFARPFQVNFDPCYEPAFDGLVFQRVSTLGFLAKKACTSFSTTIETTCVQTVQE